MKQLIMTEGSCEKAIIYVLIMKKILKFSLSDLLYEEIFHNRQIKDSIISKINQLPYNEKINIIRIGDKLADQLRIPKEIAYRVNEIQDYCTTPELEILYIIYYEKYEDYLKLKSSCKPSEYLKSICQNYKKTYVYHYDFFSKLTNDEIVYLFAEYNRLRSKTHDKSQKLLTDLFIVRS